MPNPRVNKTQGKQEKMLLILTWRPEEELKKNRDPKQAVPGKIEFLKEKDNKTKQPIF